MQLQLHASVCMTVCLNSTESIHNININPESSTVTITKYTTPNMMISALDRIQ